MSTSLSNPKATIDSSRPATLTIPRSGEPDQTITLPARKGTYGEVTFDASGVFAASGGATLGDPALNSVSVTSSPITFIDPNGDGRLAVLLYRGYPVADLAEKCSQMQVAYLLMNGELPDQQQLAEFSGEVTAGLNLPDSLKTTIAAMSPSAHPMAMLGSALMLLGNNYPPGLSKDETLARFDADAKKILGQTLTIAAMTHRVRAGLPLVEPDPQLGYVENFLKMSFADKNGSYVAYPLLVEVIEKIFMLHADHEQNASTTITRNITSTDSNPYAAVTGGIGALWGRRHGGANVEVIDMLKRIQSMPGVTDDEKIDAYLTLVEEKKATLYGFGHRIYKAKDPRAAVMEDIADRYFSAKGIDNPLLKLANRLEERARQEDYFIKRKLWPNVDFYSGILMQALGFNTNEFTVLFAVGRMAGWLAQAREVLEQQAKIVRPRQVYTGPARREV